MPVTTAPTTREKRRSFAPRKRKKKSPGFIAIWWPLVLGILVTPFTIHAASIVALAGPGALMTLYPWVLLLKSPALGLGENLSQLLIYIQFPLYGVLMALILRSKSLWVAFGFAAAAHLFAMLAVILTHAHTL